MDFKLKNIFQGKVNLDQMECELCEFGHGISPRSTEEFDNYGDANNAGIEMAKRHGGGDVTVIESTRVVPISTIRKGM